jgi:DsbC/DsbD-like thiol-disulfide interchange protein
VTRGASYRTIAVLVAGAAAAVASGATAEESHVRTRLVADAASVEPGRPFLLGVELVPEPGWHVYWRNPGEAGLATEVLYRLPDGFSAAELLWPTPVEFEQPGGLVGYGYEDRVVLAAEVTAPPGFEGPAPVVLEASWLACKDVCVLESATLPADVPLVGAARDASATAFESWRASLPSTDGSEAFELSVTGGSVPESGAAALAVWLSWKAAPGAVELFPDPGAGLKVEVVRVQTRGTLTRVDLVISRLKTSAAPATTLRALIVTRDTEGNRRATVSHIAID